jgi:hypothetical protein
MFRQNNRHRPRCGRKSRSRFEKSKSIPPASNPSKRCLTNREILSAIGQVVDAHVEKAMPISIHASCRDSDARMHELCSAIGNRLHADYMPTLAEPLPRELKDLIAQLVAFEIRNQGSSARPIEVLRSVIADVVRQPQSTGPSIGRKTDQMG